MKIDKTKIVKIKQLAPIKTVQPVVHQRVPRLQMFPPDLQLAALLRPRVADQVIGQSVNRDRRHAFTWALFTQRSAK